MKRTWIEQPKGKNTCGQIAVAVITGKSVEEVIKLTGKKGGTNTKDLAKALRALGYKCPDRCVRKPRPKLGIGHLSDSKRKSGWHWVTIVGDKIYDGAMGTPDGMVYWPESCRLTSYLPVEE